MSGGGAKAPSSTTTTTQPWPQQQRFLTRGFNRADAYFQQGKNAYEEAPLYSDLISGLEAQGRSDLPNEAGIYDAYNQALNARTYLDPLNQQVMDAAAQQNAATQGVNDLVTQTGSNTGISQNLNDQLAALQGFGSQAYGNASIPALYNAAGSQWSNPYQALLLGTSGSYNPYISGTADTAALAMLNPALAQLYDTASGAYLTPETNPYLQQAVQAALDRTQSQIAGQFNAGGRYGSGMMAGIQAREMGNVAATAYAQQYEAERQKMLAAQQALGGQYLQGVGQLTQGQQAAGQLSQGQTAQQIQALLGGGQLAGTQQQLAQQALAESGQQYGTAASQNLAAQQSAAQVSQQQVQNALESLGLQGQISAADLERILQGNQLGYQNLLGGIQTQANATQLGSDIMAMEDARLAQLGSAASLQQQLINAPQEYKWQNLANYMAMVNGAYGGTATGAAPAYGSGSQLGSAAGGALSGAAAGTALMPGLGTAAGAIIGGVGGYFASARYLKTRPQPVDREAIVDGMRRLPLYRWSYLDAPSTPHIGPMADDFAGIFGAGDAERIHIADSFGVLFTTVQHLLAANEALAARLATLEGTSTDGS